MLFRNQHAYKTDTTPESGVPGVQNNDFARYAFRRVRRFATRHAVHCVLDHDSQLRRSQRNMLITLRRRGAGRGVPAVIFEPTGAIHPLMCEGYAGVVDFFCWTMYEDVL